MRITGIVKSSRIFGPDIELRRTITSRLGVPGFELEDRFTNYGNETVRFAWLYHINFGYPLLEPGASTYCFSGKTTGLPGISEDWYREGNDFKSAPQPLDAHRSEGEYCGYINANSHAGARDKQDVLVGVVNRKRGLGVKIEY